VTTVFTANLRDRTWRNAIPSDAVALFHRGLDGYSRTPLVELPELATALDVGRVFAKDESLRLGLPAFKALGASWAVERAIREFGQPQDLTIVTATDGNHGRAIARFSRLAGSKAKIVVPRGLHPDAIAAIRNEGASVEEYDGDYDAAVARAASVASVENHVLIQDTAWEGYEEIPRWIIEGYETLFAEIDEQLAEFGVFSPDLLAIPTGVGSLLHAALAHYRCTGDRSATAVISVEPDVASCMAPSLEAGEPVTVSTGTTRMSGLNCGTPSSIAWEFIRNGLDAAVSVTDSHAIAAARKLVSLGLDAGPCGGAGLAGTEVAIGVDAPAEQRSHLGVDAESVIVFVITEGGSANPLPD